MDHRVVPIVLSSHSPSLYRLAVCQGLPRSNPLAFPHSVREEAHFADCRPAARGSNLSHLNSW